MTTINSSMFSDNGMFEAVKEHTSYYTKKHTYYNSLRTLKSFFSNTKLTEVNGLYIKNLFLTATFKTGQVLTINRFLIFLLEHNLIKDDLLSRLIFFKERITHWGNPKDIIEILSNNNLHKYTDCNFFVNKQAIKLFFIGLPKENIIDDKLYNCLSSYFDDFKINSSQTLEYRYNSCYFFLKVISAFYTNIKGSEINREYICACIEADETLKSSHLLHLSNTLLYLISNNVIKDEELQHLLMLKDYLLTGIGKDTYLSILKNDNFTNSIIIPLRKHNKVVNYYYLLDIDKTDIRNAWINFSTQYKSRGSGFKKVCEEFDTSLNGFCIKSIKDLNFNTFVAQLKYFSQYNNKECISVITAFYLYIYQNHNNELFIESGVDIKVLQRQSISQELLNGYEIVSYNPMENVPDFDKWVFCYSDTEVTNMSVITTSSNTIDFTRIKSNTYRFWCKHFIWNNESSLYNKLHSISQVVFFLNYISDLKEGKELSIYGKKTHNETITINEVFAYKNHVLNKFDNNRTQNRYIYIPRAFLKHVSDHELSEIESGIFYHLSYTLSSDYDNTKAISDKELKKLASLMKQNADVSVENKLYYSIFYISLETEFRGSQILALTTDCVQEASKPNQYVIKTKTKTSYNETVEQPITTYVKKHIDEILKITKKYRDNCNIDDLKKYLFLVPTNKKGTYGILRIDSFNNYFKKCCKTLGIEEYTISNLRDTHMTKAEEYIIRNSLSDVEQSILSGHKSSTTDTKHYIDTEIKNLLESVHGIIIGNVNIEGQIVRNIPDDIATKENTVSHGCGYCSKKYCDNYSYLDCLMCKDFVTTIDRIPYFKEQIKIIDKKIQQVEISHDKEDLVNIKRLLAGYLKELLTLKGDEIVE